MPSNNKKYDYSCEHSKYRYGCKICYPNIICEHGKRRYYCFKCKLKNNGGGGVCKHNKRRYDCKFCKYEGIGGKGICCHQVLKRRCQICKNSNGLSDNIDVTYVYKDKRGNIMDTKLSDIYIYNSISDTTEPSNNTDSDILNENTILEPTESLNNIDDNTQFDINLLSDDQMNDIFSLLESWNDDINLWDDNMISSIYDDDIPNILDPCDNLYCDEILDI